MHRIQAVSLAFTLAACAANSDGSSVEAAGGRDVLPYKAVERTLANGLKVIVVPTPMASIVSLQIPVQTGSRNEVEVGKTGFAHFFEHMMFRGTEKFPPAKYESLITQAGARQNAYTTDDYTNYHITFAKPDLEKMLEIEADRFQNLAYSEEQFRTEARAVLGEYNKNSANPINKLFEVLQNAAFTTHTYKHTTMGFLADIEVMPDQMAYAKTFFDRWYRPEYTTVMVVGDVDPDTTLKLVEKHWGGWKRGSYSIEIPREPEPTAPKYAHVPWDVPTQPIVAVSFHGPAFSETASDSVALDLLLELNFGSTSPLYKRLVLEEQKADSLGAFSPDSKDPSLATIFAQVREESDMLYVRDAILDAVAHAKADPIDEARLAEAKASNRYGTLRTLDSTDAIASRLARYVHHRRSFDTFNALFRLYDAAQAADLRAAGAKYLRSERMVVTTLSHGAPAPALAEALALPTVAPRNVDAEAKPVPPTLVGASGRLTAPWVELPGGGDQRDLRLQFLVGSASDPVGKEGLAAVAAAMVADAGSADLTLDEIQKILFPIAGGFGDWVDREMTTFSGSIHVDNLGVYLRTVLPQLVAPGWREEDFKRVKAQAKVALVQALRTNNEEELGKEALQAALFAGTPYGHPTAGTVAGLEAITLDDVKQFVAQHYTQANLIVGVAGELGASRALLESQLAKLPAGTPRAVSAPTPHRPSALEVDILQKETRATAMSFGHPIDVVRGHPDFVALYLARTWLGEHRSSMSHLYQRIREVRGMNYGDYAYIEAFRNGGGQFFASPNQARRAQLFEVWIRPVKPEHAHHALRIALHELDLLIQNGLSQADFEATREYLSKNVFLALASPGQTLGARLDSRFYGIDEYTSYMRQGLAALTREQVNDAIRRHLSAEKLRVVIVAKDAEGLKQALLSDAPSTMTYESEKPASLLEEDRLIGARKLGLAAERVRILPIADVFAR